MRIPYGRVELLSTFDENVLTIDAASMISRYRTTYRSGFTRFFNGQYKKDRRLLLGFCKHASKMTYEEVLLGLDKICTAKELWDKYEHQASIVKDLIHKRTADGQQIPKSDVNAADSKEHMPPGDNVPERTRTLPANTFI